MAVLWSIATLACGLAQNFEQMFLARLCVGIGEAAYGSVGIAVVLSVFPARLRATMTGAFMAGGMFGSVLGMAAGGVLAAHVRLALVVCRHGAFGLGACGRVSARSCASLGLIELRRKAERRSAKRHAPMPMHRKSPLATVFATRSVICAYVGSGLQLFIGAQPDRLDAELS